MWTASARYYLIFYFSLLYIRNWPYIRPEALGVVPAAIYLLVLTLLQLSVFQVTEVWLVDSCFSIMKRSHCSHILSYVAHTYHQLNYVLSRFYAFSVHHFNHHWWCSMLPLPPSVSWWVPLCRNWKHNTPNIQQTSFFFPNFGFGDTAFFHFLFPRVLTAVGVTRICGRRFRLEMAL